MQPILEALSPMQYQSFKSFGFRMMLVTTGCHHDKR